jgi:hypothetical protein
MSGILGGWVEEEEGKSRRIKIRLSRNGREWWRFSPDLALIRSNDVARRATSAVRAAHHCRPQTPLARPSQPPASHSMRSVRRNHFIDDAGDVRHPLRNGNKCSTLGWRADQAPQVDLASGDDEGVVQFYAEAVLASVPRGVPMILKAKSDGSAVPYSPKETAKLVRVYGRRSGFPTHSHSMRAATVA